MKKTDTFFVISNYNTDPSKYIEYCENYIIYDQSTEENIKSSLINKKLNTIFVENSGHSITNYFRYFIDNYDTLPSFIMLLKSNIIGRHITEDFFNSIYDKKNYTFLYDDRNFKEKPGIAYQLYDGAFLEINNSWYRKAKPYKYFETYNDLLRFVFKNPIYPKWILFSPGACYIITKEQVRRYPKAFYENLMYLVSYRYFPSEAYHIERMLHIIFCGIYELNEHMLDCERFNEEINQLTLQPRKIETNFERRLNYLKELYHKIQCILK
jgi:hypothetical protein